MLSALALQTVRIKNRRVRLAGKMREEIYLATWSTAPGKCEGCCGLLLHELVLDGVAHELSVVLHLQFFQDTGAIGADGLDAER